jgi:heptaprenyl diphosphate synthase
VPFLRPFADYAELALDLPLVERRLREVLQSDVPLVTDVIQHPLRGGGKRLRPALVLLGGRFSPEREQERLINLAAAAELIHMATLVHDDVVDQSSKRRGQDTVNARWGDRMAVLGGDYLLGCALTLIAEWGGARVLVSLSACVREMAASEMRQFGRVDRLALSETDYLDWIEKKTALFIGECAHLGAMGCGAPDDVVGTLWRYGRALGLCFQIVDDLLDFTSSTERLGKSTGEDVRNGVPTLPVIHALRESPERERLRVLLENGRDPGALEDVLSILRRSGSLEYAFGRASSYAAVAHGELARLPDIPARRALAELTDDLLHRTH